MQQITYITIDVGRVNSLPSIVPAKQGDTGRVVQATVTDKGTAFDMTGATAIARIHKPDGTNCLYDEGITIEGNVVTVPLVDQALTAHGRAKGEINLYTSDADRITTFDFWIDIEKSTVADGEIVSSDYYNALTQTAAQILATNTMVKPLDYYATLAALEAAVTSPNAGDMYGVGAGAPYDYYVYSPTLGWVNNGQIGASGIPYLGKTSGSAAAFTIDYTGAIGNGQPFVFMPHADGLAGATLKIGANPAYPILNHDGTAVDENMLYAFVPIVAIYRAASADAEAAYIVTLDGTTGAEGEAGKAATIEIGTVTTGEPGTQVSVTNSGNENAAVFDFTIPRGEKGNDGKAATVKVGTVTDGTTAAVTNSGNENAAVFNFTLPRGKDGENGKAATIAIGKVTTGAAGSQASVSNTGSENAAVLDFTIPTGKDGQDGKAATIQVGSVTTSEPGSDAQVSNGGSENAAVFNFVIPRGQQGPTGKGFKVLGYYATLSALKAGVPSPEIGDAYGVGTSEPYDIYIYDSVSLDWVNNGPLQGAQGPNGQAATVTVGSTTTGAAGTAASVTNTGTNKDAVLNFTIPAGKDGEDGYTPQKGKDYFDGEDGAAATITVGTVTTGEPDSAAQVTNSGNENAAVFDFVIPAGKNGKDGEDGKAATISIGSVTTGAAGSSAEVTNSGTENAAVLNFTIPEGKAGKDGQDGAPGQNGSPGYTPQRGTDYWTDADKAEIEGYVDTAVDEAVTALNITGDTTTTLNGLLKGNGANVQVATAGTDYMTPPATATALPSSGTALTANTVYNVSAAVGTYSFRAPSTGWAHGKFTTGSSASVSFAGTFLGAAPSIEASKTYEFDVLNGVWAVQEVVSA